MRFRVAPGSSATHATSGGDDYELCFTIAPKDRGRLAGLPERVSVIGRIEAGSGVSLHSGGRAVPLAARRIPSFPLSPKVGSSSSDSEESVRAVGNGPRQRARAVCARHGRQFAGAADLVVPARRPAARPTTRVRRNRHGCLGLGRRSRVSRGRCRRCVGIRAGRVRRAMDRAGGGTEIVDLRSASASRCSAHSTSQSHGRCRGPTGDSRAVWAWCSTMCSPEFSPRLCCSSQSWRSLPNRLQMHPRADV